jgi:inner membrane transporter RhtA
MSLEPAIAALIGWVVLKETISFRALIALTLIMVASGGTSLFQKHNPGDER